jgi:uncharacterized protein YbjT (DUF2867 family)
MSSILVLNATGKVSRFLIDALVSRGHHVVAASRHPSEPSTAQVRRVHFAYDDPSTWESALAGVDRLFFVAPPMVLDSAGFCGPFFAAALPRLHKVVLMTAAGIEFAEGSPLRRLEQQVEASGVAYTFLRPSWFHDNFHTFWIGSIRTFGVIALPAGDGATAFIDSRDISESAATALLDPSTDGQAYTLTGGEALRYDEAAQALSAASGRTIGYQPISDEDFVAGGVQAGMPEEYCRFLTVLFGTVRAGFAAGISPAVEHLTGHPPRTLRAYAEEHAGFFAG